MGMENSHLRVQQVVDKLKASFESTPYIQEMAEGKFETKSDIILSVIIPARNEFPNIMHTIYSLWHCSEADCFNPNYI